MLCVTMYDAGWLLQPCAMQRISTQGYCYGCVWEPNITCTTRDCVLWSLAYENDVALLLANETSLFSRDVGTRGQFGRGLIVALRNTHTFMQKAPQQAHYHGCILPHQQLIPAYQSHWPHGSNDQWLRRGHVCSSQRCLMHVLRCSSWAKGKGQSVRNIRESISSSALLCKPHYDDSPQICTRKLPP